MADEPRTDHVAVHVIRSPRFLRLLSDLPRRMVPLVAVILAAPAGAVAAATPAHADSAACTVDYQVDSTWDNDTAFQATVSVRNIGSVPTTKWWVLLTVPADIEPGEVWGSTEATGFLGGVKYLAFNSVSWNAVMAPGGKRYFGFLATGVHHTPAASLCEVW